MKVPEKGFVLSSVFEDKMNPSSIPGFSNVRRLQKLFTTTMKNKVLESNAKTKKTKTKINLFTYKI